MLTVVLAGSGIMGRLHADIYGHLEGVRLVGIVDPGEDGPQLAAQAGVPHWATLEAVTEPYDLLDLAVPTFLHAPLALGALRRGISVLVEKPLALTLEDAERMLEAAQKSGARLLVGHVVRYFPEYVRTRELIAAGELGEVAVVRTFRGGPFPRGWRNWYADPALSGGPFVDLVIHDFDFLLWTLGPVDRVSARAARAAGGAEVVSALLRFRSGALAQVTGSWAHPRFGTRLEVAGSRGLLTHDSLERATVVVENSDHGSRPRVAVPEAPRRQSPYASELADLVASVVDGRSPRVTAEEAFEALRLALAARQAALTGRTLTVAAGA
jgi:UDP-N-acetylglucosamine 3-dehydrogenase